MKWLSLILLCFLASCTVGPKYAQPTVPTAPAYTESAGWKTAQPSDAFQKGKWWEIFNEPELNTLEEQVAPANQSLKIAEANYREARASIQFQRSFQFPTVSAAPSITTNRISANYPVGGAGVQYGLFTVCL
jgi:outer membrane protein TolC